MHESYEYSVLVVEKKDISRKKKKNKKREKTDTTTATDVDSTYTNSIFHPNKLIGTFRVSKYGRSASRNTKQNKTKQHYFHTSKCKESQILIFGLLH